MNYNQFLEEKRVVFNSEGMNGGNISEILFDYQQDITDWSLRKGRSAVFADTGLGKTFIQLEWAKNLLSYIGNGTRGIIFAPLAVAEQTIREAEKLDLIVQLASDQSDVNGSGIYITNYQKLHKFDMNQFDFLVLDESSILKSHTGKYRTELIDKTREISFKLCCTATPSPNDFMELGNHAEFLGVMSRNEMLSTFFVNDGSVSHKWRLKKHGVNKFWEWVASWAVMLRKPSDLGYENRYKLPELNIIQRVIGTGKTAGFLFQQPAETMKERRDARRDTIENRCQNAADIINASDETWLVWCDLNAESALLNKLIPDAKEITGSQPDRIKKEGMLAYSDGSIRVLVTKPKICGFGMNWDHTDKMMFVGLSDSFEAFYQAVRRAYRFPREKNLDVYFVTADIEGNVVANIKRKEKLANEMYREIQTYMREFMQEQIRHIQHVENYFEAKEEDEKWTAYQGDCVELSRHLDDNSIDYSIFSPPFAQLYTYSDSERDMGNSSDYDSFWKHFKYLSKELYRVIKPGRLVSIHCMNIPLMKERDGYIGIRDFRGDIIRDFQGQGFIYHSEVCIWKDPLIEVTRTHSLGLMHKQLQKDSAMCRQGLPDYIVTMRKPGLNKNPITHPDGLTTFAGDNVTLREKMSVVEGMKKSHEVWRNYASPIWSDIRQTNTLNIKAARDENDERHICPLQLDTIERCLTLWTNSDDLVLSPFAGIGSEGYQVLKMGRRFIGFELKASYFSCMISNLKSVEVEGDQGLLF